MFRAATVAASRVLKVSSVWQPCSSHTVRLAPHSSRSFHTSRPSWAAPLATPPHTECSVLIMSPSPDQIMEQGYGEVDIVPPREVKIQITDRAAEQLQHISARERNPDAALRVVVESGGCHGYQYKLELATERKPDDYHLMHPTQQPSNVLVDAVSMSLLNGSTIDFATELIGSSFRIVDNPQAKGSGCGCGVSWELKV